MLCSGLEAVDGGLYILGGGLDTVRVTPNRDAAYQTPIHIALRIIAPHSAAEKSLIMALEIVGPDEKQTIRPLNAEYRLDRASRYQLARGIPINVALDIAQLDVAIPGTYRFILTLANQKLAETALTVVHLPDSR